MSVIWLVCNCVTKFITSPFRHNKKYIEGSKSISKFLCTDLTDNSTKPDKNNRRYVRTHLLSVIINGTRPGGGYFNNFG